MFLNIMPCCRKCLNSNETLYVKTINNCSVYIYMYLCYRINGKVTSKQSPVFGPGKSQIVTFPYGAQSLFLRIYGCHTNPPVLLFMRSIVNDTATCDKVIGDTTSHMAFVEIPC